MLQKRIKFMLFSIFKMIILERYYRPVSVRPWMYFGCFGVCPVSCFISFSSSIWCRILSFFCLKDKTVKSFQFYSFHRYSIFFKFLLQIQCVCLSVCVACHPVETVVFSVSSLYLEVLVWRRFEVERNMNIFKKKLNILCFLKSILNLVISISHSLFFGFFAFFTKYESFLYGEERGEGMSLSWCI